jgi:hypothetical protein
MAAVQGEIGAARAFHEPIFAFYSIKFNSNSSLVPYSQAILTLNQGLEERGRLLKEQKVISTGHGLPMTCAVPRNTFEYWILLFYRRRDHTATPRADRNPGTHRVFRGLQGAGPA